MLKSSVKKHLVRDLILINKGNIINKLGGNSKISRIEKYFNGKNQNRKMVKTKILVRPKNDNFFLSL